MNISEFETIRNNIPTKPGVYQFFQNDTLLYVGKAINLKKRVSSYFQKSRKDNARLKLMVNKITDITFTVVHTEEDALLLENNLIKTLKPRYNIILKDGKSYPFICIKSERFPRVFISRKIIKDGSEYFGPYTSAGLTRSLLTFIKNTYQVRTCSFNLSNSNIKMKKFKVCLDYHIGKCLGPCEAHQTENDYNKQISEIRSILAGKTYKVLLDLDDKMRKASDSYDFEDANIYKERINQLKKYQSKSNIINPKHDNLEVYSILKHEDNIYMNFIRVINGSITLCINFKLKYFFKESLETYLLKGIEQSRDKFNSKTKDILTHLKPHQAIPNTNIIIPLKGDKKKLLDLSQLNLKEYVKSIKTKKDEANNALSRLKEDLNINVIPKYIECFDISHNQGNYVVGSLVVYKNGKALKTKYRHYNIKHGLGNNDYESMKEVIYRHFSKKLSNNEPLADLVIIDGGKPQLNAAISSLKSLGINRINIFGLAKKLESVISPNKAEPIMISKRSTSLRLLQKIRNEAHRFAIDFHRKKSRRAMTESVFTNIPGIGKKTSEKLIKELKSIEKIKSASLKKLTSYIGSHKAQIVYNFFS